MTTASHAKNRNGPWAIKDGTGDLIGKPDSCSTWEEVLTDFSLGIMQLSTWKHEKDDERVMRWTERISEEMKHAAKSEDKLHKYLYVNNVDETQDAFASYEPENLERMRTVSKRYDPDGVFQKLRSGGPKLWK